jgi:hypothetical protein
MTLERGHAPRLTFGAALLAALVIASATVAVRAPAHAGTGAPASLTLTGSLAPLDRGIVERSFEVPPGTAQLDLDLAGLDGDAGDPLDFGARGPAGIRGWSTARHNHVHIDATSASLGYLPGPIEAGEWHVMLGAVPTGGAVTRAYTITIHLSDRLASTRPTLRSGGAWFAGDLHVHSGHSDGYHAERGRASTPVTVGDLASRAERRGLDFLAVTDHNTASHWVDVDRTQAAHAHLLLLHGREITTARGHFNAIGERRLTDFRLGPERPMARVVSDAARDGAFVSINHAWLTGDEWCGGCGWLDRDPATLDTVNGIEVINGSTPSPDGDLPGWRWWAELLNRGRRLTAVGGSDVHDPANGSAAIGVPATVVHAGALSEEAIVAALKTGRAFVRNAADPRLGVELRASGDAATAEMGQAIAAGPVTLTARVTGAAGHDLVWIRRGGESHHVRLRGGDVTETLRVDAVAGDWFSVIVRSRGSTTLLSNAIYVDPVYMADTCRR